MLRNKYISIETKLLCWFASFQSPFPPLTFLSPFFSVHFPWLVFLFYSSSFLYQPNLLYIYLYSLQYFSVIISFHPTFLPHSSLPILLFNFLSLPILLYIRLFSISLLPRYFFSIPFPYPSIITSSPHAL